MTSGTTKAAKAQRFHMRLSHVRRDSNVNGANASGRHEALSNTTVPSSRGHCICRKMAVYMMTLQVK